MHCYTIIEISFYRVSPFGHLRIEGCLAPPRSVSPPRRVLHRHSSPRHPPYALVSFRFSVEKRKLKNRNDLLSTTIRRSTVQHFVLLFYLRICTKLKRPNMGNFSVRCNLVVNDHHLHRLFWHKKTRFSRDIPTPLGASLSPPRRFKGVQHID